MLIKCGHFWLAGNVILSRGGIFSDCTVCFFSHTAGFSIAVLVFHVFILFPISTFIDLCAREAEMISFKVRHPFIVIKICLFFLMGKKWIYLERYTVHRQSVHYLRKQEVQISFFLIHIKRRLYIVRENVDWIDQVQ